MAVHPSDSYLCISFSWSWANSLALSNFFLSLGLGVEGLVEDGLGMG